MRQIEIKLRSRAKINIGLDVTGVRDDGYHLVRMIMQSVDLCDDVTIRADREAVFCDKSGKDIRITCDRPGIPCDERNLAWKAASLLMDETGIGEPVTIDIVKRIPVAAGLAGGSGNAAAVLLGMNELFNLGLSGEDLCKIGLRIGADVPYCLTGKTMLAEGIGEVLTPLKDLPKCHILLAKPDMDVSTAHVYGELDRKKDLRHPDIDAILEAVEGSDLKRICAHMGNILEEVTEKEHGVITEIKKSMKKNGALNALMSGSGPTVFGIFEDIKKAEKAYDAIKKEDLAKQVFITAPI
ncbi:MAG: 4-(cytidine 5'-diphospho)-2-C-methyl-D-erythritol kinase [Lachnospiraceae bacterium]|nr:4-(cytidine 5'-diphospho)-2-C-methyl-D-erythritol kinase [Lachnospiraceae bacterium]